MGVCGVKAGVTPARREVGDRRNAIFLLDVTYSY